MTFGGVCKDRAIAAHPDTGHSIAGVQVPFWNDLLQAAMKLAEGLELGYIGVDFVVDANLGPVVLEANVRPGLNIQVANRRGLAPRLEYLDSLPPERLIPLPPRTDRDVSGNVVPIASKTGSMSRILTQSAKHALLIVRGLVGDLRKGELGKRKINQQMEGEQIAGSSTSPNAFAFALPRFIFFPPSSFPICSSFATWCLCVRTSRPRLASGTSPSDLILCPALCLPDPILAIRRVAIRRLASGGAVHPAGLLRRRPDRRLTPIGGIHCFRKAYSCQPIMTAANSRGSRK